MREVPLPHSPGMVTWPPGRQVSPRRLSFAVARIIIFERLLYSETFDQGKYRVLYKGVRLPFVSGGSGILPDFR